MIENGLMVTNSKGGVLKTTLSAHLGASAAAAGWRTLAIDLDTQGNLARDLGYLERSDGGAELIDAVRVGRPPRPLVGVRPGLDVLPGGPEARQLASVVADDPELLTRALTNAAGDYDLVVFDCPPGDASLTDAAMLATHFLVIPTTPDDAALDGLGGVFSAFLAARRSNPSLEVLGVTIGPLNVSATAVLAGLRTELAELLGDDVVVFEPTIRLAQAVAVDARRRGMITSEYEAARQEAPPWYTALRAGKRAETERYRKADELAADWSALTAAVLRAFGAAQERHRLSSEGVRD